MDIEALAVRGFHESQSSPHTLSNLKHNLTQSVGRLALHRILAARLHPLPLKELYPMQKTRLVNAECPLCNYKGSPWPTFYFAAQPCGLFD